MPTIGRRKSVSNRLPAGRGGQPGPAPDGTGLDALVDHCLAAHAIVERHGTPTMRRLLDLLLFEIGSEIGGGAESRPRSRDLN